VEAAEARYAAGRGVQADVLAGIVDQARLQQDEAMARERAQTAASRLNLLRGADPDAPIGPLEAAAADPVIPALADLEAALIGSHPQTGLVNARRALAEKNVAVAAAERRPDYVVQAGYMTMPFMTDAITARVGITWPNAPWVKHRTAAMTRAADAELAAAEAQRAAVGQRLRLMAQDVLVRARAAAQRARIVTDVIVPRAQYALEVAAIAYEATRGELMPVVDARRTLVEVRLDIHRALGDRDRALAELRALLGDFDARQ
jgi:outer membrane protein TolC